MLPPNCYPTRRKLTIVMLCLQAIVGAWFIRKKSPLPSLQSENAALFYGDENDDGDRVIPLQHGALRAGARQDGLLEMNQTHNGPLGEDALQPEPVAEEVEEEPNERPDGPDKKQDKPPVTEEQKEPFEVEIPYPFMKNYIRTSNNASKNTIVTAYFNKTSEEPPSHFWGWAKNLMSVKDAMIIFTDIPKWFVEHRRQHDRLHKTYIIHLQWNQTKMTTDYPISFWKHRYQIDAESQPPPTNQITNQTETSYRIYPTCHEKVNFLYQAIRVDPFRSDFFAWVDLGYFRTQSYRRQIMLHSLPLRLQKDQVMLLNVQASDDDPSYGGGFLGGFKAGLQKFHSLFYALLDQKVKLAMDDSNASNKSLTFIDKDQPIWYEVCNSPEAVDLCFVVHPIKDAQYGHPWSFMAPYLSKRTSQKLQRPCLGKFWTTGRLGNQMMELASTIGIAQSVRTNSSLGNHPKPSFSDRIPCMDGTWEGKSDSTWEDMDQHRIFVQNGTIAGIFHTNEKQPNTAVHVLRKTFQGFFPLCSQICPSGLGRQKTTDIVRMVNEKGLFARVQNDFFIELNQTQEDALIGHSYLQSFKYFEEVHDEILELFRFRHHVSQAADAILQNGTDIGRHLIRVAIHARRTDMLHQPHMFEAPVEFFRQGIEYFRQKYNNATTKVIFYVASDDLEWCRQEFHNMTDSNSINGTNSTNKEPASDIVVLEDAPPEVHLAALSKCHHMIVSSGTYGWWAAYLGPHSRNPRGEVLYFPSHVEEQTDYYPENWKKIELPKSDTTV